MKYLFVYYYEQSIILNLNIYSKIFKYKRKNRDGRYTAPEIHIPFVP